MNRRGGPRGPSEDGGHLGEEAAGSEEVRGAGCILPRRHGASSAFSILDVLTRAKF